MKILDESLVREKLGDQNLEFINEFYLKCKKKYKYLALKEETWIKFFNDVIKIFLESKKDIIDFQSFLEDTIEKSARNYINKLIQANDTRILINIFNYYKENYNGIELLIRFLEKIDKMKLKISEEYFEIFKKECLSFRELLIKYKVLSVDRLYLLKILKNYETYAEYQILGRSFYESTVLLEYYLLLREVNILKINIDMREPELKLFFKSLIRYHKILNRIYDLFVVKYGFVDREIFDKIICNLDLKQLQYLVVGYQNYNVSQIKDESFLYMLYGYIKKTKKSEPFNTEYRSLNKKRVDNSLHPIKDIYSRFPDYPEISISEKIRIIDELIMNISHGNYEILDDYFNKNIASDLKEVFYIIKLLIDQYKYIIKNNGSKILERKNRVRELIKLINLDALLIPAEIKEYVYDISLKKIELLIKYLKVLELQYREKGYSKQEYFEFMNLRINAIFYSEPGANLYLLLKSYINSAYQDLNLDKPLWK